MERIELLEPKQRHWFLKERGNQIANQAVTKTAVLALLISGPIIGKAKTRVCAVDCWARETVVMIEPMVLRPPPYLGLNSPPMPAGTEGI
jgi:hypothetical protein